MESLKNRAQGFDDLTGVIHEALIESAPKR